MDEVASDGNPEDWADIDPVLVELTDRASAAGLGNTWVRWRGSMDLPSWLELTLPSGRRKYTFQVEATQGATLASFAFEQWTVIDGYYAVLDQASGEIFARVDDIGLFRWTDKLPNVVRDPEIFQRLSIEPAARFVMHGPDQASLALEVGYPSPLDMLFGLRGGQTTLRVSGVKFRRHDDARRHLVSLAATFFFELDLVYGMSARLAARADLDDPLQHEPTPVKAVEISYPIRQYPEAPVHLYLHASEYSRGFTRMPLAAFLAYYQVVEHFWPVYVHREARERFRRALKNPSLNPDDDVAVTRLVTLANETGRNLSEREQMKATVAGCCDDTELRAFINADPVRAEMLADAKAIRGVRPLQYKDGQHILGHQVADRLYDLRCRIVHTKDGLTGDSTSLLPFDAEARRLGHDIALVRFVAQRAIIAASVQRNSAT